MAGRCEACACVPCGAFLAFAITAFGVSMSSVSKESLVEGLEAFYGSAAGANGTNGTSASNSSTSSAGTTSSSGAMATSVVDLIALPFTILMVLNVLALLSICFARSEYQHDGHSKFPEACHCITRCLSKPCSLCILNLLEWIMFHAMLVLSQVFLMLFFVLTFAMMVCNGGSGLIEKLMDVLSMIQKIPGHTNTGGGAEAFLEGIDLNKFCGLAEDAAGSAFTFYLGALVVTCAQALMASSLNGEKARVEEFLYARSHMEGHAADMAETEKLLKDHKNSLSGKKEDSRSCRVCTS